MTFCEDSVGLKKLLLLYDRKFYTLSQRSNRQDTYHSNKHNLGATIFKYKDIINYSPYILCACVLEAKTHYAVDREVDKVI